MIKKRVMITKINNMFQRYINMDNYQKFLELVEHQNKKKERYQLFKIMFQKFIIQNVNNGKLLRQIEFEIFNYFNGKVTIKMINRYTEELIKYNKLHLIVKNNITKFNKELTLKKTREKIDKFRENIVKLIKEGKGSIEIQNQTGISRQLIRRQFSEFSQLFKERDKIHWSELHKKYNNEKYKKPRIERYKKAIQAVIDAGEELTLKNITNKLQQQFFISKEIIDVLKQLNLLEQYYHDTKERRKIVGIKNGKPGRDITKNYWKNKRNEELKVFQERLKQLINSSKHRTLIEKILFSQFPTIHKQTIIDALNKYNITKFINTDYYKNPMFGKSPSIKSGIGCKGWFYRKNQKLYFRSSLELKIFCFLDNKGKNFVMSKFRIPYLYQQKEFTYLPDIELEGIVYEIKPLKLQNTQLNQIKMKFAKEYLKQFNIDIKYLDQTLLQNSNIEKVIETYYNEQKIEFCSLQDKKKFLRYNKGIIL